MRSGKREEGNVLDKGIVLRERLIDLVCLLKVVDIADVNLEQWKKLPKDVT